MGKVLIFGSGGFAKEIIAAMDGSFFAEVVGVVSTEPFNNPLFDRFPIYEKAPDIDARYIMGVSDPELKRKFVAENKDHWVSWWHDSVYMTPFATIGRGCVFMPFSGLSGDAIVGDFVTYNVGSFTHHDCVIGDYTTFSPYAQTMGYCNVGEGVFFGANSVAVPKVDIVTGAKISAGAVVRKSITEPVTVYGDPAKPR